MTPTAYGAFSAAGAVVAVIWLARQRRGLGVSENEFWAAMWLLLLGGIIGAKLLFLALGWEHYARGELSFWGDFGTGYVFFGGLAGAALAGALFAAARGLDFARGADYFAVALPLGHAIGRIGCFMTGCCHGVDGHPVQLYEAGGLVLIAFACREVLRRVEAGARVRGDAFRLYLILYAALRIVLDLLRGDGRPERLAGISYQQGIALGVILLALVWPWIARAVRTRRAHPPHRQVR